MHSPSHTKYIIIDNNVTMGVWLQKSLYLFIMKKLTTKRKANKNIDRKTKNPPDIKTKLS